MKSFRRIPKMTKADEIVHDNVGKMLENQRESKKATEVMLKKIGDLTIALEESLQLQAHYAKLLNQYDEGRRMVFLSPESWMARLRETGKIKE